MSSTRADRGRSGSLAGLLLCMVMHVGNSGGRACWAAGQIGESAHPGQRVSAKDPRSAQRGLGCGGSWTWRRVSQRSLLPPDYGEVLVETGGVALCKEVVRHAPWR